MWIKRQSNYVATIRDLFGAIEQELVSLVDAIKDPDYYDAAVSHLPIIAD
jgi:hypothetical protein